ncbi:CpaF family protein [Kiloniella majae]|uniref:CpaF family protein n=1 Tax=Kiloniella majae TaxID=1938558 RepID=UPI000A2784DD|nr:CpaF family protein [Kiloniella majae]
MHTNQPQNTNDHSDHELKELLKSSLADKSISTMSRPELSLKIGQIITEELERQNSPLNLLQRRSLITNLINWFVDNAATEGNNTTEAQVVPVASLSKFESRPYPINKYKQNTANTEQQASSASDTIEQTKSLIQPKVMDRLDISAASKLPKEELSSQLGEIVGEILFEDKLRLNAPEKAAVIELILADMLGLGPLEPLLADENITDIMVNGPNQVYIEKSGKLQLTDVSFRDNDHVMNVARRIVAHVGRRVDETTPLCDARLADGSRVNIIIPPLAIDGSSISIRKFAKQSITLDIMKKQKNISPEMATVMKIASRSRLNILISGGTGSGKTTLLNALSQMIDHGERIVTIEDAAELQLQQPHVVRLETRPPNLEGEGAISMRDLVKNSLRMRPDRIILGEIRGSEAVDMLQAMNTGHDGSLGTVHANRPREALTRLENMVGMAGINLPAKAVRTQIADALDMIIQVSRMRDGMRRITHITEIIGMEGDIVTTQDLFTFNFKGEDEQGNLTGDFVSSGLRPNFYPKAEYFSLGQHLMDAMG